MLSPLPIVIILPYLINGSCMGIMGIPRACWEMLTYTGKFQLHYLILMLLLSYIPLPMVDGDNEGFLVIAGKC